MARGISCRGGACPASPIRKLVPIAERVKSKGKKVYHLNIGQPDIKTPDIFWQALISYPSKVLAYGNSQGETDFRASLSRYYTEFCDIELNPDEIIVTTGGSEAIIFAMLTTSDPGDNFIVFEPFYTNYNGYAVMADVSLKPIPTNPQTGYHLPEREVIESAIDNRTRGIIICSPNNPTGTVLTLEEMNLVKELALKYDLFVISDEVYREFAYEYKPISVMHIPELQERAILLDSISKRFSACGARIGNIATKNKDIIASALRFGQARLCPPRIEQFAAKAILDNLKPEYFVELRQEYMRRRDAALEELAKIPGVFCQKPSGAFYLMVKLPISDTDDFAEWLLADYDEDGETVMVAPGAGFYATKGLGKSEVRIAYVLEENELRKAIRIFGRGLERYREIKEGDD